MNTRRLSGRDRGRLRAVWACGLVLAAGPAARGEVPVNLNPENVQAAVDRGMAYLLGSQNPDGSWGGPQNAVYTFTGEVWSNPETHRAWKVATTGLGVMATLSAGHSPEADAALDKGIDFIIANASVRRPSEWDTMNCWAQIYGVQALSEVLSHPRHAQHPRREEMAATVRKLLADIEHSQSVLGGWGYLELEAPRTERTQWATSFTTSSAVVALAEAQRAGLTGDPKVFQRAVDIVRHCRLANGAFSYHVRAIPNLQATYIDQVKGSLSRIQAGHVALLRGGDKIPAEQFRWGIEQFFEHHKFLDIALNKPIPHETYYYNSGYFYLYGHYYAAMAIEQLPAQEQAKFWPMLQREVMKIQQADGSMWDYDMHNYHKPYGTSFGVLALSRSLRGG